MHQAVLRAEEVHERAELHDLHDLALVDRADLGLVRDALDARERLLDALAVGGRRSSPCRRRSMSIFAPAFRTISRITEPPEPMTSRILSIGILIVSMRGACSPSSVAGARQRLGHLAEDVEAALVRLLDGDPHDLLGDAGDLDVHLQRR